MPSNEQGQTFRQQLGDTERTVLVTKVADQSTELFNPSKSEASLNIVGGKVVTPIIQPNLITIGG